MNLDQHSALIVLLAGVAFFMYGMTMASDSLQKLGSNRIRELLSKISKNNFLTVGVGVALTVCLQSSGAVTSMLVSLGKAGVVTLPQVMGIILGTAVGTTLTVQLISFNVAHFGLPIFAVAFSAYFVTKKRTLKNILTVLMGFGLIFFGIEMIGLGTDVIQKFTFVRESFLQLSHYPLASLLIATAFTGFVHSSAVTIGFAMSLASSGLITFHDSLYWIFGANIGTTSTALIAAIGGNYIGRQVAWAHCLFKTVSVLIFLLVVDQFANLVILIPGSVQRDIANAHTIYNFGAVILFFPFISTGAKWIEKMFAPRPDELEFSTAYLDDNTYQSSTLAVAFSRREILRMSDIVLAMAKDCIGLFQGNNPDLATDIAKRDSHVDMLHHEIKLFLVRHSRETHEGVNREIFDLISFANDLESAADVIDNNLMELGRKKEALKLEFSKEGWKEIEEMHRQMVCMCTMSISAFQLRDPGLAGEVIELKRKIRGIEKKFRESHIERLNKGLRETINTSSIHLDILGDFTRIVGIMCRHAYSLLQTAPPQDKQG